MFSSNQSKTRHWLTAASPVKQIYRKLYEPVAANKFRCILYGSGSARSGPIANLKTHLRVNYNSYYVQIEDAIENGLDPVKTVLPNILKSDAEIREKEKKKQMLLDNFVASSNRRSIVAKGQLLLAAWSVVKAVSANSLNNEWFVASVNAFGVDASSVPDRRVLHGQLLDALYALALEDREKLLRKATTYSATSDGFTEGTGQHTTSLTVHFIDPDSLERFAVLGGVRYVHAATGEEIATFLEDECETIVGKKAILVGLVQDGAAPCVSAAKRVVGGHDASHCAAHVANLVAQTPLASGDKVRSVFAGLQRGNP